MPGARTLTLIMVLSKQACFKQQASKFRLEDGCGGVQADAYQHMHLLHKARQEQRMPGHEVAGWTSWRVVVAQSLLATSSRSQEAAKLQQELTAKVAEVKKLQARNTLGVCFLCHAAAQACSAARGRAQMHHVRSGNA